MHQPRSYPNHPALFGTKRTIACPVLRYPPTKKPRDRTAIDVAAHLAVKIVSSQLVPCFAMLVKHRRQRVPVPRIIVVEEGSEEGFANSQCVAVLFHSTGICYGGHCGSRGRPRRHLNLINLFCQTPMCIACKRPQKDCFVTYRIPQEVVVLIPIPPILVHRH